MSSSDWCLIESDPGCFTELIKGFGVTNVVVEEVYSFSEENFKNMNPIYGLIFLFKWQKSDDNSANIVRDSRLERLFYAKQVINNACATQAILSVILNAPVKIDKSEGIELGQTLGQFKEFTKDFDPQMKGLALSNSDIIRDVHNSFARQQMFEFDAKQADKDDDVFHFISYIPFEGRLYELDGLREGPIDLGSIPEGTKWVDVAKPIIEKRMHEYSEGEIQFNLMAVTADKTHQYKSKLSELEQQIESGMVTDTLELQISELRDLISEDEARLRAYKVENIRRKHNHLPLIMEIMKKLASQGKLVPLAKKAKEKSMELHEKRVKQKAKLAK